MGAAMFFSRSIGFDDLPGVEVGTTDVADLP